MVANPNIKGNPTVVLSLHPPTQPFAIVQNTTQNIIAVPLPYSPHLKNEVPDQHANESHNRN